MPNTPFWIALTAAYLCGSIPFAYLLGLTRGIDIRKEGSKNIGSTNLGRLAGKKWGIAAFFLDTAKGVLPVLAAGLLFHNGRDFVDNHLIAVKLSGWNSSVAIRDDFNASLAWVAIGISAVLGHVFPVWLGFKGGKGVATSLGVLLGFWPVLTVPGLGAFAIWGVCCYATGYVSLASIVGAAAVVPLAFLAATQWFPGKGDPTVFTGFALLLAVLVIVKHRANIQRLRQGTESKAKWTGKA